MPTEISNVIGEITQTRDDIAQIIRDRGSYIAPNTKLKELVPYVRSMAQQELEEGFVTPTTRAIDMYPSEGYVGFSKVTVDAIPFQREDKDVKVDGATVNIPYGYFKSPVQKSVASGSATTPSDTITVTNTVTIDANGLIVATASGSKSITPTVTAGYVSNGTAGTVSASGAGRMQLTKRTSSDLTVSGATVTAPAGYYPNAASTTIPATMPPTITFTAEADDEESEIHVRATATQSAGYVTGGSTYNDVFPKLTVSGDTATMECNGAQITRRVASATQATPSITVSSTGLITASATQTEGYVSAGTESTTKQLTTQAGKTITPTTSNQTAVASGRYTTGAITVKGDSNLVAGNIKKGVSIFGVTGTYEGSGGAGIATCNVTITFGASVGGVRVVATTFASGAFGTFNQYKSSGTFTLENVVCGSVISLGGYYNFDVSKGYSGASGYFSDSAYWIAAPSTAGNYTAQIIAYED